jgi:hypothetical protein
MFDVMRMVQRKLKRPEATPQGASPVTDLVTFGETVTRSPA